MTHSQSDILFQTNKLKKDTVRSYSSFSMQEAEKALSFHKSMPSYQETPLISMKNLAAFLGVKDLWLKDESSRFNLNSFKILGSSYALAKFFSQTKKSEQTKSVTFDRLIWGMKNRNDQLTLATASDGNHGCGLAHIAQVCETKAHIFVPAGTSAARVKAMKAQGAEVTITDKNYDETLLIAYEEAKRNGWLLVQDTTINEAVNDKIPSYIMQGYLTLVHECYAQLNEQRPTHIFVQAGVGSFAAAIQAYLCNRFLDKGPKLIIVEPQGADCFYRSHSKEDGYIHPYVEPQKTKMTSLACGLPNRLAWPIIRDESFGFISCSDRVTFQGMRVLNQPLKGDARICAGESGAVGLGLVFKLFFQEKFSEIKNKMGLNEESKIMVFSTEGISDPESFHQNLWLDE